MKTLSPLDNVSFNDTHPKAEPLLFEETGRVLRFSLLPGQHLKEHSAPHSPVHIVVLEGRGMFSGGDGHEQLLGPNTVVVFKAGERHAVRALDEKLVFIALLHKVEERATKGQHHKQPEGDTYLTWHM